MRRQRRTQEYMDENSTNNIDYEPLLQNGYTEEHALPMNRLASRVSPARQQEHRFENTLEAKVEDGDTLQALALRFHCSVADIKRLNKIDKDNEIYAHKVLKIPLTVHSVLLGTMPTVHSSGNNSPKQVQEETNIHRNPLEEARIILDEKLLVASVNAAGSANVLNSSSTSSLTPGISADSVHKVNDVTDPLIDRFLNATDDSDVPQLHPIRGPALTAFDCSGSDCDISWVCLFVIILALCFVIPLLYVFYLTEHTHHKSHSHNLSTHIDH